MMSFRSMCASNSKLGRSELRDLKSKKAAVRVRGKGETGGKRMRAMRIGKKW